MPSTALLCVICQNFRSRKDGDYFVNTTCGHDHIYHFVCIKQLIDDCGKEARCPKCKKPVQFKDLLKMTGVSIAHIGSSRKPHTMKIATLGSAGVGKSTLVSRYKNGSFTPTSTTTTIGCDMETVSMTVADRVMLLRIWDTAGQERFFSMMPAYLRDVDGVLLVYDITSRKSFDDLTEWTRETGLQGSWLKLIRDLAPSNVEIFLCGNKSDCDDNKRQVSKEQGRALADAMKIGFLETSAKADENVDAAFKLLATATLDKLVRAGIADRFGSTESLMQYEVPRSSSSCPC